MTAATRAVAATVRLAAGAALAAVVLIVASEARSIGERKKCWSLIGDSELWH